MTDAGHNAGPPCISASSGLGVLVVHNRYRSVLPSGENAVVDREIKLLREAGYGVSTWIRSSDEIAEMRLSERSGLLLRPVWSRSDAAAVAKIIERDRPHILHLHNPYPLISPAVVRIAKRRGVAVVQTVHNYRHSCLNGLHLREGQICTLCVGKRFAAPGVRYGCYRGSRVQSAGLAIAESLHHETWQLVDRFLALSDFMAGQLVEAGIARQAIRVKPNFVRDPGEPSPLGRGFLYAGRLEEAKGVRLLLDAWKLSGLDGELPLVMAGDGPLRAEAEQRARSMQSVVIAGQLEPLEMANRFRECAVVVVPSLCLDGPPTVLAEALAHGRPVLATRIGSLATALHRDSGWIAEPHAAPLADALRRAARSPLPPDGPRRQYRTSHRPETSLAVLRETYSELARPRRWAEAIDEERGNTA